MNNGSTAVAGYRFGPYEFVLANYRLVKFGTRLKLERKPALVLACLLQNRDRVVTREELQRILWPDNTFVDFDLGLRVAVGKLRQALGDSADSPVYIETVVGTGYRWAGSVEPIYTPVAASSNVSLAPSRASTTGEAPQVVAGGQVTSSGRWRWPLAAMAGCVLASIVLFGMRLKEASAHPIRAVLPLTSELRVLTTGNNAGIALSPDGTRIAFESAGPSGRISIWLRSLDSTEAVPLAGTMETAFPFWSPDGSKLGFFRARSMNWMNLEDGSIHKVCDCSGGRGASWSRDNTILFAQLFGGIQKINAYGGTPVEVTKVAAPFTTHRWPEFLADGRHFTFLAANHTNVAEPAAVYLGSLDGSPPKLLARSGSAAKPVGNDLLYVSDGNLISRSFDRSTHDLQPAATIVAHDVQFDSSTWYGSFTVTADALIYWSDGHSTPRQVLSWRDSQGRALGTLGPPAQYGAPRLSPDGKSVAVVCGDPDANICVIRQDGSMTRLTYRPLNGTPTWSPDGRTLAYRAARGPDPQAVVIKGLDGNGQETKLITTSSSGMLAVVDWKVDGRRILLWDSPTELSAFDFPSRRLQPYLVTAVKGDDGAFSPDGNWVAYVSNATGDPEVYVSSYPKPTITHRISPNGGSGPRWSEDGRHLFFLADKTIYRTDVAPCNRHLKFTAPYPLFRVPALSTALAGVPYDVTADGTKFIVTTELPTPPSDLVLITNWRSAKPES